MKKVQSLDFSSCKCNFKENFKWFVDECPNLLYPNVHRCRKYLNDLHDIPCKIRSFSENTYEFSDLSMKTLEKCLKSSINTAKINLKSILSDTIRLFSPILGTVERHCLIEFANLIIWVLHSTLTDISITLNEKLQNLFDLLIFEKENIKSNQINLSVFSPTLKSPFKRRNSPKLKERKEIRESLLAGFDKINKLNLIKVDSGDRIIRENLIKFITKIKIILKQTLFFYELIEKNENKNFVILQKMRELAIIYRKKLEKKQRNLLETIASHKVICRICNIKIKPENLTKHTVICEEIAKLKKKTRKNEENLIELIQKASLLKQKLLIANRPIILWKKVSSLIGFKKNLKKKFKTRGKSLDKKLLNSSNNTPIDKNNKKRSISISISQKIIGDFQISKKKNKKNHFYLDISELSNSKNFLEIELSSSLFPIIQKTLDILIKYGKTLSKSSEIGDLKQDIETKKYIETVLPSFKNLFCLFYNYLNEILLNLDERVNNQRKIDSFALTKAKLNISTQGTMAKSNRRISSLMTFSHKSIQKRPVIFSNTLLNIDEKQSISDFSEKSSPSLSKTPIHQEEDIPFSMNIITRNKDPVRRCISDSEAKYMELSMDIASVTINDFVFLRFLGKGAYGSVWLVKKISSNDLYAMKVIELDRLDLNSIDAFKAERNAVEIIDGDFVVRTFYFFKHRHSVCYVLEFMPGGDFASILRNFSCFYEDVVKFYSAELVLAIESLHAKNIIHRDLKPENILLDEKFHIKLADFGLSDVGLSKTLKEGNNRIIGTPDYIPPEVIEGNYFGNKTIDWWSLGIIIYELVTGIPPFNDSTVELIFENIIKYNIEWPEIGEETDNCISYEIYDLIRSLLNPNPLKRLGFNGSQEVKNHKFFNGINWINIRNVRSPLMVENINTDFDSNIEKIEENQIFKDFKPEKSIENSVKNLEELTRLDFLGKLNQEAAEKEKTILNKKEENILALNKRIEKIKNFESKILNIKK